MNAKTNPRRRVRQTFPLVPASEAQRQKMRRHACLVCGRTPVDPAHIVPRRLGGCDDPLCTIPLCRPHHRAYDAGLLALAPHMGRGWRKERRHARDHTSRTKLRAALGGKGWT